MKIRATPIKGRDLVPGDLFSTHGPEYWDQFGQTAAVGEKVYIRTTAPTPDHAGDQDVYRIEVIREEQS